MITNSPIGIFDSGVGGLTVLKEVIRILPNENIVYLGDTARVPYGTRSEDTIIKYSYECADFLLRFEIKILIIACNTASAISLDKIKDNYSIPIVGVIEPGARASVSITKSNKVGVIGTEATIRSNAYKKAINLLNPNIEVYSQACPLFVPLVEEGWNETDVAEMTAKKYLHPLQAKGIDTLVLGCTHYPLLKKVIQKIMGSHVTLVDSAIETAKAVKTILEENSLLSNNQESALEIFVTDSVERFKIIGERFLSEDIKNIQKIVLK
ncbi:MAG: glutamate racemase [Thermodesulfovibrionales bacterium]|nr:glutamate racemase [Thermodesulfovibrionales bacterium]